MRTESRLFNELYSGSMISPDAMGEPAEGLGSIRYILSTGPELLPNPVI